MSANNNNNNNKDDDDDDDEDTDYECDNIGVGSYSLLVIRFDIHYENYEPPGLPIGYYSNKFNNNTTSRSSADSAQLEGNLFNLFDTDDVYVIVYAAKTGRRIVENDDNGNGNGNGNNGDYMYGDDPDNYYEKYLTMAEAYELSQNGLRTCVPNNVCLMVGISKVHSSDYSVTMYSNTNTDTTTNTNDLLDNSTTTSNDNTTTATISSTSIIAIPGVLYREGKKFPYLFASDSITFTQIEGTFELDDGGAYACQSSCPLSLSSSSSLSLSSSLSSSSSNHQQKQKQQSLLEFDYWTGEVVTSPYWTVLTTNTANAQPNDHNDDSDRSGMVAGGCGYNCNYPQQRVIRETICLDHATSFDDGHNSTTTSTTGKYIDTDKSNDSNNNNSTTDYLLTASTNYML